jgi:hypothetical protein
MRFGAWKQMDRKRLAFGLVFAAILLVFTLAGIELLASFIAPSWPARALNPRAAATAHALSPTFKDQPWLAEPDNSWGVRDRERSVDKAAGMFRAVFVGDSFVESRYTRLSLPAKVQQRLDPSESRLEAVDLGVGATDPRSYYFRIRDVALAIHPDALLVFLYAGNDFMPGDQSFSTWPRLVDESPGGSLLGWLMPRTNWLVVNRLDLSSFFRFRSRAPANDDVLLYEAITAPKEERLRRLVSYVRTYIDPPASDAEVAEILSRGDSRYLEVAQPGNHDQEYLVDWMLRILMLWEAESRVGTTPQDVVRLADRGHVDATLSWIKAIERLAREHDRPLLLFLIPVGSVDPQFREFWAPWPRAYLWNRICEIWHAQLAAALSAQSLPFVDLTDVLAGVPGTYRKLDGHWTEKGETLVADRVAQELAKLSRMAVKTGD